MTQGRDDLPVRRWAPTIEVKDAQVRIGEVRDVPEAVGFSVIGPVVDCELLRASAGAHGRLDGVELRVDDRDRAGIEGHREDAVGEAAVFFDDLAENVSAARACGWNAVHIDHEGDTARQVMAGLRAHGAMP